MPLSSSLSSLGCSLSNSSNSANTWISLRVEILSLRFLNSPTYCCNNCLASLEDLATFGHSHLSSSEPSTGSLNHTSPDSLLTQSASNALATIPFPSPVAPKKQRENKPPKRRTDTTLMSFRDTLAGLRIR